MSCGWERSILHGKLRKNIDIDARNEDGYTPLMVAANSGEKSVVERLLRKGANIDAVDIGGNTALMRISIYPDIDLEMAKFLIDSGANIDHVNVRGETALSRAYECKDFHTTKFLVECGADTSMYDRKGNEVIDYLEGKPNKHDFVPMSEL
jgi:uncharacterized protein